MSETKAAIGATARSRLGDEIVSRINQLGAISETGAHLARIFLSPEHRIAADLLMSWMKDAGMAAHLDAIGNVCGRYEGERPGLPCLMLGSHYDTVRDAGKWDGPLGVISAIACVADLNRRACGCPLRSKSSVSPTRRACGLPPRLLGSRAVAGTFDESVLDARDRDGLTMREAMVQFGLDPTHVGAAARTRRELHAYVELHIEQGPVLEQQNLPVGVVTAICRRHAAGGEPDRHGRACRHGADGDAARRAGRRRRMHCARSRSSARPTAPAWSAPSVPSPRFRARPT